MAWFWTDDLARILVADGLSERAVADLLSRPAAIAAPDQEAALLVARRLVGVEPQATDAA